MTCHDWFQCIPLFSEKPRRKSRTRLKHVETTVKLQCSYRFVPLNAVGWHVVECSPYCRECVDNGPGKCDSGKCSPKYVYDSDTMTCKGIRTILQLIVPLVS